MMHRLKIDHMSYERYLVWIISLATRLIIEESPCPFTRGIKAASQQPNKQTRANKTTRPHNSGHKNGAPTKKQRTKHHPTKKHKKAPENNSGAKYNREYT
jgi:hypothetical protein